MEFEMKWLGILMLSVMPFGYVWLMHVTDQPVEWFVVGFIAAMAGAMLLFATVLKKHTENTPENAEVAKKILKKAIKGIAADGDG